MFKSIIYFNDKKISEYGSILDISFMYEYEEITTSKDISGSAGIPMVSGNKGRIDSRKGKVLKSYNSILNKFEKLLSEHEGENYYNFIENKNDYDLKTINRNSIILFTGKYIVPDEFDMHQLIDMMRPFLIHFLEKEEQDAEYIPLINHFFDKKNEILIPIIIREFEDIFGIPAFAKLDCSYLEESFDANNILDEFDDTDLIFLAKFKGIKRYNGKERILYNMEKDLFPFPRAIRRQLNFSEENICENIVINEDYFEIELLAIYN